MSGQATYDEVMVAIAPPFVLEHSYSRQFPELAFQWQAEPPSNPSFVVCNDDLAEQLGISLDWLRSEDALNLFSGRSTLDGGETFALAYAGHQFGSYSPRLGDGRALLIGEGIGPRGDRYDLHLKGSGRTPFARGGDGRAVLGPMLREYILGESMSALGVPTTRALAVISTGEAVRRERPLPGAILVRVASSHIRVGTFQYAAAIGDIERLRALADYTIERHYPTIGNSEDRYLALLNSVVDAQAKLIAQWMLVGFIHGVMNTDNMTISGETIDYGPCAFMERVDSRTVFSSIDEMGRYAYGKQPSIGQWNLARFAETLLPLIAEDPQAAVEPATEVLVGFQQKFDSYWLQGMRQRLGLVTEQDGDESIARDLVTAMSDRQLDLLTTFRALSTELRGQPVDLGDWTLRWRQRLEAEGRPLTDIADNMDAINPVYVPRNHLVESVLADATNGSLTQLNRLMSAVRNPYVARDELLEFSMPGPIDPTYRTYCGT